MDRLACGAGAGVIAATATYPLDLARTRLSLATGRTDRIFTCLANVYKNEGGFTALYRGLTPTLIGIAPLVALNFTIYETLKTRVRSMSNNSQEDVSVATKLLCGGSAGAAAQTVTYPLDVIRRRLQTDGILGYGYTGVLDAAKRMYREEGLLSFFRGLLPNYLKVVPAISVSFVTYETIKSILA